MPILHRPEDADTLLVPWWVPRAFAGFALALLPWTAFLFISLPSRELANHWRIAWAGFDIGLAAAFLSTAALILRRSPLSEMAATVTATLLLCDAWFDVLTSRGTTTVAVAAAEAVFVELPLAFVCLWIARNVERVLVDARPYLEQAGFTIRGRRLAPPPQ